MKMFEYLLNDPLHPTFSRLLNRAIIDGSEAARFYFEEAQDDWDFFSFGTLVPPYQYMWFDFHAPTKVVSREKEMPWDQWLPTHWGLDFIWREASEENIVRVTKKMPRFLSPSLDRSLEWAKTSKWFLDIVLYLRFKTVNGQTENQGPIWMWRVFLDELGRPLKFSQSDQKEGVKAFDIPLSLDHIRNYAMTWNTPPNEALEMLRGHYVMFLHTGLLSLYFMNQKGPVLIDHSPSKQKPLTNAQKRRGETQEKQVHFKELVIEAFKETYKKQLEEEKEQRRKYTPRQTPMPETEVRGSTRTYGPNNKLFGKYEKTIYVGPYTKGKKEAGKIKKTYRISVDETPKA